MKWTKGEAVLLLQRNGCSIGSDNIIRIGRQVGLRCLGAMDYLIRNHNFIVGGIEHGEQDVRGKVQREHRVSHTEQEV